MAAVGLRNVTKRFGSVTAVENIDLDVNDGKLTVVVGPSGCGKSSLLRIIAGLEEIDAGRIVIGGRDVTGLPPARRGVAMVFQSFALYPHMTAYENMTFGLRERGMARDDIRSRVLDSARLLHIEELLERRPHALSGGQKQRIAMGRALLRNPDVFLFDEPLSSLDAALRVEMRLEIARLQERLDATMLYVTHDQVEAMTLAHQIVVMRDGRVEQVGQPLDVYNEPSNTFVAGFIGQPGMNLLPGTIAGCDEQGLRIDLDDGGAVHLPAKGVRLDRGLRVTLGVRPEHLAPSDRGVLSGVTVLIEALGAETLVYLQLASERRLSLRLAGAATLKRAEPLSIAIDEKRCVLFDDRGTRIARQA